MSANENDELLQRLLGRELDPTSSEARAAFERSPELQLQWEELKELENCLAEFARERGGVLDEVQDDSELLSVDQIEGLVRAEIRASSSWVRWRVIPWGLAAAIVLMGGLALMQFDGPGSPAATKPSGPIVLSARDSGIKLLPARKGIDGLRLLEWSDDGGSLFTEYVVQIYAMDAGQVGDELLRSPRLADRSWQLTPDQVAMLPEWVSISVSSYGPSDVVAKDTSSSIAIDLRAAHTGD